MTHGDLVVNSASADIRLTTSLAVTASQATLHAAPAGEAMVHGGAW